MSHKTYVHSLEEIANTWQFIVPIYQRLYVWKQEQIETLM